MEWYHYALISIGGLALTLLYAHVVHRLYRGEVYDILRQYGTLRYDLTMAEGRLQEIRELLGLEQIIDINSDDPEMIDDLEPLLKNRLRELLRD